MQKPVFSPASHQRGAVLMLLMLLVGVGALSVFVTGLNRATQKLERDQITYDALARAKEAVSGYAVANSATPEYLPDRNGDGNYDGNGDCVTVAVSRYI